MIIITLTIIKITMIIFCKKKNSNCRNNNISSKGEIRKTTNFINRNDNKRLICIYVHMCAYFMYAYACM